MGNLDTDIPLSEEAMEATRAASLFTAGAVWTPGRMSHSVTIERRDVPGRPALCRRLSINSPSRPLR